MRVDSAVYAGYEITPYYDSMIAKLIVHGKDRKDTLNKMRSALGEVIIEGIDTNIDYQYSIINDEVFQSGQFDIDFIEEFNQRQGTK